MDISGGEILKGLRRNSVKGNLVFIWLTTRTKGGLEKLENGPFWFHKGNKIPLLADYPFTSQRGQCSFK
jgi:hypothetical protein